VLLFNRKEVETRQSLGWIFLDKLPFVHGFDLKGKLDDLRGECSRWTEGKDSEIRSAGLRIEGERVELAADDFWGIDAACGVAGVDDELGVFDDGGVVVGGMVGDDDDCIVLAEVVERCVGHVKGVVTALTDGWEIGVVVGDDGTSFAEELDDGERRRLAQIVDVALVSEAEDEDLRAVDGFAVAIEALGKLVDDEVGHVDIDFAGEFDEAGAEVELAGLPGKVEGVDGDAVTAESGTRIEGLEAEGLGFGSVDDLVDVDAHADAELFEFVDEGDIDAAINVFEELGHLRY
jgi:hypothetical protein